MKILFHFMCAYLITFEPLHFGYYVLEELNLPHSSINIEVNLLKLNLRLGTLMYRLFYFKIDCAGAQSLRNKKCVTVHILWSGLCISGFLFYSMLRRKRAKYSHND